MVASAKLLDLPRVAPVRERGLKCDNEEVKPISYRRSREGAWIEIRRQLCFFKGQHAVAPVRERGLK